METEQEFKIISPRIEDRIHLDEPGIVYIKNEKVQLGKRVPGRNLYTEQMESRNE